MSDQVAGGGELTQFESLSAITPKKMPLLILVGTAFVIVVLWLISVLAPNEAVEDLKKAEKESQGVPSAVQSGGGDIEEI
jgi:hypothetical protein